MSLITGHSSTLSRLVRERHTRTFAHTFLFSFADTIRSLWASACSWTLLSCRPPPACARSPHPAVVALAHTSAPRTHRARQQGSGRALSLSIRSPHTPLLRSHTARLHARPQLPAWPLPQRRTAEADPRHAPVALQHSSHQHASPHAWAATPHGMPPPSLQPWPRLVFPPHSLAASICATHAHMPGAAITEGPR